MPETPEWFTRAMDRIEQRQGEAEARLNKRMDDHQDRDDANFARNDVRFDRLDVQTTQNSKDITAVTTRIAVWGSIATVAIPILTQIVHALFEASVAVK